MSHNLFADEKGAADFLPDTTIPPPPPPSPEPVDEADPSDFGLDTPMPSEEAVEEVSQEMFKPAKLLDSVDAKDWRAKNGRKAPGQRGKDKTPRKKPELTEKRKAALAKARAASSAKAKAVREAKAAAANKKIPDKQEIKMEVVELEEPKETKGKVVVIDETTVNTPVPKALPPSPPSPPKLKRANSVREVEAPAPTPRERTYSIAEFNQFKELFGGRSSVQSPVAQPRPSQPAQPIPIPQKRQPVRAGQRRQANLPNLNPQTAPKAKNPWDDMFI